MRYHSGAVALLISIANLGHASASNSVFERRDALINRPNSLFGVTTRKSDNLLSAIAESTSFSQVITLPRGGASEDIAEDDEESDNVETQQELYLPGLLDSRVAKASAVSKQDEISLWFEYCLQMFFPNSKFSPGYLTL